MWVVLKKTGFSRERKIVFEGKNGIKRKISEKIDKLG